MHVFFVAMRDAFRHRIIVEVSATSHETAKGMAEYFHPGYRAIDAERVSHADTRAVDHYAAYDARHYELRHVAAMWH